MRSAQRAEHVISHLPEKNIGAKGLRQPTGSQAAGKVQRVL